MDPPRQMTMDPKRPVRRDEETIRTGDEDELASELLFSVREVGVACFPEPDVDEGRAD
jgi:hypothetical protein